MIIDGQLHEPGLARAWEDVDPATQHMALRATTLATLAAVGVDGAVLHPLEDLDWAVGMAEADPERFAVVPMVGRARPGVRRWDHVDLDAPDLDERVAVVAGRPGVVGFRSVFLGEDDVPFVPGRGHTVVLECCDRQGLAFVSPFAGRPELAGEVAREFPGVTLLLDQMGLRAETGGSADPWVRLPEVLDLARHPNVFLKLTGLPSLSRAEFPYDDLRAPVQRVLDVFGASRCLWASDISYYQGQVGWANRFPALVGPYPGKHTYAQSLEFLRDAPWIADADKHALLGGTVRRILAWPEPPVTGEEQGS